MYYQNLDIQVVCMLHKLQIVESVHKLVPRLHQSTLQDVLLFHVFHWQDEYLLHDNCQTLQIQNVCLTKFIISYRGTLFQGILKDIHHDTYHHYIYQNCSIWHGCWHHSFHMRKMYWLIHSHNDHQEFELHLQNCDRRIKIIILIIFTIVWSKSKLITDCTCKTLISIPPTERMPDTTITHFKSSFSWTVTPNKANRIIWRASVLNFKLKLLVLYTICTELT